MNENEQEKQYDNDIPLRQSDTTLVNIPLRQLGAILVSEDLKTLSHTQVSNILGDDRKPRQVYTFIRESENKLLAMNALRNIRFKFCVDYLSLHGSYPSLEEIEKVQLKKE